MVEIPVRYELKEGKKITKLPVYITDVDDTGIWVQLDPEPGFSWHVGISWGSIVGKLLDEPLEDLKKQLAEAKEKGSQTGKVITDTENPAV